MARSVWEDAHRLKPRPPPGGAYAAAQAKCEAKAAAKGQAVDPVCLAKALEKATKGLGKAENKDDCIETGRTAQIDEAVNEFVADIERILNPPPLVCCQFGGGCLYTVDATECGASPISGALGADGSVCRGDGTCGDPPATAGPCCEGISAVGVEIDCLVGTAGFDESACTPIGVEFSTAICTRSGFCEAP